ncbi:MAG: SpoIID/LytB domain-containing protein [Lachnospiraceae bacterium]|nr:SpoIID/LytB domain-containing protein [Lachnospiraceae bacterium]
MKRIINILIFDIALIVFIVLFVMLSKRWLKGINYSSYKECCCVMENNSKVTENQRKKLSFDDEADVKDVETLKICNIETDDKYKEYRKCIIKMVISDISNNYYHSNSKLYSNDIIKDDKGRRYGKDIDLDEKITCIKSFHSESGIRISDAHNSKFNYKGNVIIYPTKKGFVIINQIEMEEYIKGVVASEMPDSFDIEAKMAQAVCSRSYLLCNKGKLTIDGITADLDDTTRYQVYGSQEPSDLTEKAVENTKGLILEKNDRILNSTFFSTSCGFTADSTVWNDNEIRIQSCFVGIKDKNTINVSGEDNFERYLKSGGNAYEEKCLYFRWSVNINENTVFENMKYLGINIGSIKDIKIKDRGAGGIVKTLLILGTEGKFICNNQYDIRKVLAPNNEIIVLNGGDKRSGGNILPSAFFIIKKQKEKYCVVGGGFGHGVGMSQYGAQKMAQSGKNYIEILNMFF